MQVQSATMHPLMLLGRYMCLGSRAPERRLCCEICTITSATVIALSHWAELGTGLQPARLMHAERRPYYKAHGSMRLLPCHCTY